MEKDGSTSGTLEKAEKRPAASSRGEDGDRPTQVVRVEDLQSLVEGIVDRALAKKVTTGPPPSDGGGECRDRPSDLVRMISVVYCNSPGGMSSPRDDRVWPRGPLPLNVC